MGTLFHYITYTLNSQAQPLFSIRMDCYHIIKVIDSV